MRATSRLQALGVWPLAYPGNLGELPGPFISEPALEAMNIAAGSRGRLHPTPHLQLLVLPYLQASVGGQGAGTGQHCLPLIAI